MTEDQQQIKTPKWLRRLEKESWQAELLISGLALYGTFYLPGFCYWLCDTLIDWLPVKYYLAGGYFTSFNLLGLSFLTTFFIVHFILRAYWVGLIGLNSVFPEGYKIQDGFYSETYSKKMAGILPDIKDTIKTVDKQCSALFSGAFALMLLYGTIAVLSLVVLLVYMYTRDFIPTAVLNGLITIIGIIIFVIAIFSFIANTGEFKHNKKMQTIFFNLSVLSAKIFTPFVFKPMYQIIFTFQSNAKSITSNIKIGLPFMLIGSALFVYYIMNSNIEYMMDKGEGKNLYIHNNTVYSDNYLDLYHKDQAIFVPVIDSDIIEGSYVKLFIPILKNESSIQDDICGEYKEDESIKDEDNLIQNRNFYLDCAKKYIHVFINQERYTADLLAHKHSQQNRNGLLCYIPGEILSIGKNTLTIEKLENKDNDIYESHNIQFWYTK